MKIEHIAIWVNDLEKMRAFYEDTFQLKSNEKYTNPKKEFESYFLSFENGARIEIMKSKRIFNSLSGKGHLNGFAHLAISVGSKEKVDVITEQIRAKGLMVHGEPRVTGDGYYESVVLDPEGNHIEITE